MGCVFLGECVGGRARENEGERCGMSAPLLTVAASCPQLAAPVTRTPLPALTGFTFSHCRTVKFRGSEGAQPQKMPRHFKMNTQRYADAGSEHLSLASKSSASWK